MRGILEMLFVIALVKTVLPYKVLEDHTVQLESEDLLQDFDWDQLDLQAYAAADAIGSAGSINCSAQVWRRRVEIPVQTINNGRKFKHVHVFETTRRPEREAHTLETFGADGSSEAQLKYYTRPYLNCLNQLDSELIHVVRE